MKQYLQAKTHWWIFLHASLMYVRAEFDGRWPTQMGSPGGLCRYGGRVDCCWGWTRQSWGHCQPVCHHGCKHGQCTGPNKCKCHPGFTGNTCNQGHSELYMHAKFFYPHCPYETFKENSQRKAQITDIHICAMANCQYGCEVVNGEVHCQCPSPGLHLAPDGRTCVDIDECVAGLAVCPRFQKCVNTFGSYMCRCYEGFVLQSINGKYQCTAIPRVIIDPPRPGKIPPKNRVPDADQPRIFTLKPPLAKSPSSPVSTAVPPRGRNPAPHKPPFPTRQPQRPTLRTPLRVNPKPPFPTRQPQRPTLRVTPKPHFRPWRPPQSITKAPTHKVNPTQSIPAPTITSVDNRISKFFTPKQRGDVHIPRKHGQDNGLGFNFDVELGNTDEEMGDDPEVGVLSCTFDHGFCGWMRDRGDTQWIVAENPSGGKYLTVPEVPRRHSGRGAQLVLPLTEPWNQDFMCLSFRHKLVGHHVGMLQVFVEKGQRHSPAMWSRTRGNGWMSAQITLWGSKLESVIIKGERRRNQQGEIALDDVTLRAGQCPEEYHLKH